MKQLDGFGLPGCLQSDGTIEGGDSAAIWGTIVALTRERNLLEWMMNKQMSFIKKGKPVRHPSAVQWYGETERFTRDQMVPILCAGLAHPELQVDLAIINEHSKNYYLRAFNRFKNKNGFRYDAVSRDWTLFQVWALETRRLNTFKYFRWIFDIENFLGALIMPLTSSRVTRNHMLIAIRCYLTEPTFVSRATFLITNWYDVIERWRAHCDAVGEYQTADLFEEVISEIFRERSKKAW